MVGVFTPFRANTPQLFVDVDRTKAKMLGIPLDNVFEALQTYLGSVYVNDFNMFGRTYQVTAQAAGAFRNDPRDILRLKVRNTSGAMVPLGSVVNVRQITGPDRILRYNMFPAAEVNGDTAPGISSGQAITTMERLAKQVLPSGMGFEWTDLAYQQTSAGNIALGAGSAWDAGRLVATSSGHPCRRTQSGRSHGPRWRSHSRPLPARHVARQRRPGGRFFTRAQQGGIDTFTLGPRVFWAAFDLGRVRARIKAADARTEAALAQYEQRVLLALEETENTLVDFQRQQARRDLLRASAQASEKAVTLARLRYQFGVADFLTVLDAERTLLNAQDRLAESETRTATTLIAVYKALGGGWEPRG
jgi:hypothetical protein